MEKGDIAPNHSSVPIPVVQAVVVPPKITINKFVQTDHIGEIQAPADARINEMRAEADRVLLEWMYELDPDRATPRTEGGKNTKRRNVTQKT